MSNVLEDITKSCRTLLMKEHFYGLILASLNKGLNTTIPTACVSKNGINFQLSVNPEFFTSLKPATRIGVLKHELLHIAFMHLLIWPDFSDHDLANIAADLEINQFIDKEFKDTDWVGLELSSYPELKLPPKAGMREYYKLLSNINNKRPKDGNGKPGDGGSPNDGSSDVKSKIWDVYDASKRGETVVCSHEMWKEIMDSLSEADRKLIQKQIDYQLKEHASSIRDRGLIPGEMESYINSLFEVKEAVIDWRAYVRRYGGSSNKIYTKKSRRKLNKRFSDNPALKIKQKKNLLVGIDTSGSVSDDDLREFFNEIYHIHKTGVKVTIIECDARINSIYEYKGVMPEKVTGRGGTDFQPVIDYFNANYKKFNSLIYLTDGYCSAPNPAPRNQTLWVICSKGVNVENLKDFKGAKVKINHHG